MTTDAKQAGLIEKFKKRQELRKMYGKSGYMPTQCVEYNKPFKSGSSVLRFVENVDSALREVGTPKSILGRNYGAWYTDDFHSSTLEGVVFRLPHGRMIAGYIESENGGVALCFDEMFTCEREAAFRADSIAQHAAEIEREHNEGWQDGQQAQTLKCEELPAMRATLIGVIRELKALRKSPQSAPNVCAYLTKSIRESLAELEVMRAKLQELVERGTPSKGFKPTNYESGFLDGFKN